MTTNLLNTIAISIAEAFVFLNLLYILWIGTTAWVMAIRVWLGTKDEIERSVPVGIVLFVASAFASYWATARIF